jgi:hypothetical protein
MRSILAIVPLAGILAACAEPAPTREVIPTRAIDFRPSQIRQLVVFAQLRLDGEYSDEEKKSMPEEFEGVLLEELNARAVLVKEVRVTLGAARRNPGPALARARELDADHAVVVDVRVSRRAQVFCQGTRRRFQAVATQWDQSAEVVRTSDGTVRYRIAPESMPPVLDLEADCDSPWDSRRITTTEGFTESVKRLAMRLLSA